jgi:predicted porin
MKKTIIASAIAAVVAAPAAFADIKISGAAQQEFLDIDGSTVGYQSDSAYDLNFSASEDLGNGMKAFAAISLQSDYDNSTTNGRNDQKLGLSGDFGTITVGKIETYTEGKISAMASVDSSESLGIEPGKGGDRSSKGGSIQYVSPSMNGLTLALTCQALEDNTTASNKGDDCDTTDVAVAYTNGALTVKAGNTEYLNSSAGAKNDATAIAVSYKMGDLYLVAVDQDFTDNGVSKDAYMVGAKYTMGNNTFGIGMMNTDTSATADEDQMIFDFTHNLSKNVAVYVTHHQDDNGTSADVDSTAVGMKMNF